MDLVRREVPLKEEVEYLISLKQEGGYWDFKKQWYVNKTDMLHDIICMANNLHSRTAYIIIGVDEEHGYSTVDISADPNRRNTQKIVDFLKDKKFAGGVRPVVCVESFCCYGNVIDVIVIAHSYNTPFYLTSQYEGVRANNIYTRIMDTNTPIDKSADINHVEQLWRKRFHLDDTPISKFNYYLRNPNNWERIQGDASGYFYKYAPEYTVTYERKEDASGYEYYMFGQINTNPSWWRITLKYYQTAINQFSGNLLDGGGCFIVAPCKLHNVMNTGISLFGFYIQDDVRYRLLEFYHCKETSVEYSYTSYMKTVVVFRSARELKSFLSYVQTHMEEYRELCEQIENSCLPSFPELDGYNMDAMRKEYRDALAMKKMLSDFRTEEKL